MMAVKINRKKYSLKKGWLKLLVNFLVNLEITLFVTYLNHCLYNFTRTSRLRKPDQLMRINKQGPLVIFPPNIQSFSNVLGQIPQMPLILTDFAPPPNAYYIDRLRPSSPWHLTLLCDRVNNIDWAGAGGVGGN